MGAGSTEAVIVADSTGSEVVQDGTGLELVQDSTGAENGVGSTKAKIGAKSTWAKIGVRQHQTRIVRVAPGMYFLRDSTGPKLVQDTTQHVHWAVAPKTVVTKGEWPS